MGREVRKCYNYTHLHSGINFITPYQRHYSLDKEIIKNRIKVYKKAKTKHPERWSKNTKNWSLPKYVSLNPISEDEVKKFIKKRQLSQYETDLAKRTIDMEWPIKKAVPFI